MENENIEIFDNLNPFPRRTKVVNLQTKNFLHFLLADEYFIAEQSRIRCKLGIPDDGYPAKMIYESLECKPWHITGLSLEKNEEYHNILGTEDVYDPIDEFSDWQKAELKKFTNSLSDHEKKAFTEWRILLQSPIERSKAQLSIDDFYKKMCNDLDKITKHYNLPDAMSIGLSLLVLFNSFLNLRDKPEFLFLTDKDSVVQEIETYPHRVGVILLYQKTSLRQLTLWLQHHWLLIEEEMDKLKIPQYPTKKSTILKISQEIYNIKQNNNNKSYKDIADDLSDKYPNDSRVTDETWVKETYLRYKETFENFKSGNNK